MVAEGFLAGLPECFKRIGCLNFKGDVEHQPNCKVLRRPCSPSSYELVRIDLLEDRGCAAIRVPCKAKKLDIVAVQEFQKRRKYIRPETLSLDGGPRDKGWVLPQLVSAILEDNILNALHQSFKYTYISS